MEKCLNITLSLPSMKVFSIVMGEYHEPVFFTQTKDERIMNTTIKTITVSRKIKRLTEKEIKKAKNWMNKGVTGQVIAEYFGVHSSTIYAIKNKKVA